MWSLHRAIRGNFDVLTNQNLDLAYNENHKSIYDAILGLAYLNHVSSNKLGSPLHLLPALYLRLFHTFETHKFLRLLKCITFSFLFFLYFFIKEDGPPKYLLPLHQFILLTFGLNTLSPGDVCLYLDLVLGCQGVIRGKPLEPIYQVELQISLKQDFLGVIRGRPLLSNVLESFGNL